MKPKKSFISNCLESAFILTFLTFVISFQKLLSLCPPLLKALQEKMHKKGVMAKTGLNIEDYADSFTKFSTLWVVCQRLYEKVFYESVIQGGEAPNPKVLSSNGSKEYNLLDFAKPGRPLVLNFGSCS